MNDPLENFIDWQRRSIWREDIYKHRSKTSSWNYGHHKETKSMINTVEDKMIDAYDKTYNRGDYNKARIEDLYSSGYTEEEIQVMTGLSIGTISKYVQQIKAEVGDEGNKD
jgi:hypothetical protein